MSQGEKALVQKAHELLAPYQGLEALTEARTSDGKSLMNPMSNELSPAYNTFPSPIKPENNGFDIHVYYFPTSEAQTIYVKALYERIRREFPELRIYRLWDKPVGPHVTAMFEINVFTPQEFGAIVPWLVVNRGPLSILVHPNTNDVVKDHTTHATWIGPPMPVDTLLLERFS